MRTLFTLTGNLLAETTATFDMPREGATARARADGFSRFQVGGKGVNVSKAARLMGAGTCAAIFPAGFTGQRCAKHLENENFCELICVKIIGETREGLVCVNSENGAETTFLGADVPVPEAAFREALAQVHQRAAPGDALAICGSFPGWKPFFAEEISHLCKEKKLRLCIDTYGAPLKDLSKEKSALLKINRRELFSALADGISDDGRPETFESAFEHARKNCRAKIFAASDGASPALFNAGGETFSVTPPAIREVSATGSGDIMFACLICELFGKNTPPKTAARRACALAAKAAGYREIFPPSQEEILRITNE